MLTKRASGFPARIFQKGILIIWRIVALPEFQIQYAAGLVTAEKILVAFCRLVPALVLNKFVVGSKVHGQRLAAVRAAGNQLRWEYAYFPATPAWRVRLLHT